ncbi:MAG: hypothetical protein JWM73_2359 [Solirubrobacterales bacterium]|nr:hypothetical protein [Solirubrobacterales bacterium]
MAATSRIPLLTGIVLTLALRAAWWPAALSRDEGGVLMVARAWHPGHAFAYGPYFLDRPPLLVLLYRLAGDRAGVRVLGTAAAVLLVVVVTLLAARLGGRAGAWVGGLTAAALASAAAIDSVLTTAELLAAVPASASALLLVAGLQQRRLALLAGAGAAAAGALLVKQSFLDVGVAGLVGLAVVGRGLALRQALRQVAAYAGGAAAVLAAMIGWDLAAGLSSAAPHSLLYALFGFRLDAVAALAAGVDAGRWTRLVHPVLASGLILAIPAAVLGLALARQSRGVRPALLAWLAAGVVGVAAGGSYWPHYLIELVAPVAVGLAVLAARRPAVGVAVAAAVACTAIGWTVRHELAGDPGRHERFAVLAAEMVRDSAQRGDTAYMLYAKANALDETGMASPFPYHWSLMMRAVPGAERDLRALLASPRRPTWIVQWQSTRAFGLDRDGLTRRILAARYRPVGSVCGHRVLLARSAGSRVVAPAPSCPGARQPSGHGDGTSLRGSVRQSA